ncbi:hypothetical protein [Paracoccus sp. (in: a-proteobacteria)]|uniref:hypothetical protein n=1 Tax=Paracoccus sp. TaxID=267 RepID=UPI00289D386A|nr:hypothetical protein [Paracoccus sp. (in: a-proteobacteria)]
MSDKIKRNRATDFSSGKAALTPGNRTAASFISGASDATLERALGGTASNSIAGKSSNRAKERLAMAAWVAVWLRQGKF